MSEITRRLEDALADLAEHYDQAMTRQAEHNERLADQNEQLQRQVNSLQEHLAQLAELGQRLERQVNNLARDYAGLGEALREQSRLSGKCSGESSSVAPSAAST